MVCTIKGISVKLPKNDKKYRPDQPKLVKVGEGGRLEEERIDLYSGQSVVFLFEAEVSIGVILEKEDDKLGPPIRGEKFHFRKSKKTGYN